LSTFSLSVFTKSFFDEQQDKKIVHVVITTILMVNTIDIYCISKKIFAAAGTALPEYHLLISA
jgi:hypothetical protein